MRWSYKKTGIWYDWFAWYPVTIDGQYVWLEWVQYRFQTGYMCLVYYYRFPQELDNDRTT